MASITPCTPERSLSAETALPAAHCNVWDFAPGIMSPRCWCRPIACCVLRAAAPRAGAARQPPEPLALLSRQLLSLYRFVARNLYDIWVTKARHIFGGANVLVLSLDELKQRPAQAVRRVWQELLSETSPVRVAPPPVDKRPGSPPNPVLTATSTPIPTPTLTQEQEAGHGSRKNQSSGAFRLQPEAAAAFTELFRESNRALRKMTGVELE